MEADWSNLLDIVYPVGSIYMTDDSTVDPGSLFGGTWSNTSFQGRFLCSQGNTEIISIGKTGGISRWTYDNMPTHDHIVTMPTSSACVSTTNGSHNHRFSFDPDLMSGNSSQTSIYQVVGAAQCTAKSYAVNNNTAPAHSAVSHTHSITIGNTGFDPTYGVLKLPAYYGCYIWERTA